MKKTLLLFLLAAFSLSAQQVEKRPLGTFTKLEVTGHFDVQLVKTGDAIIVSAAVPASLPRIKTVITNGTLRIYADGTVKGDVDITVPYTTLNEIVLNGSGDISADSEVQTKNLKVVLTGSGDIKLKVAAADADVTLIGSGDLILSGTADAVSASVNGSGDLDAGSLRAKTVRVTVTGSGDATVYASGSIKADVEGSGDIRYKGNPEQEDTSVHGSGSITKV
ncbi:MULTISPECIES: head GIN domain-containing protein [unclassified Flavobacterium]|uniref:head GIN domain-containing protein n=1 Tax=unclassified Flavobacterium TaxID=196869 RepID=UPI001F13E434|nr:MULTISPECIES: head GIN domain-containing protein [unclassified Flavobacterium]UMY64570.1 DUF2807 domain-containing protein [Flavobacterium sp. HJ-32-4]